MTTHAIITKQNSGEEVTSIKFDVISNLPVEIVNKIYYYLPAKDLLSAISCCMNWRATVRNQQFWKRLCKRDDYFEVEEKNRSAFYTNILKKYNYYWQGVYWYNYNLQRNWETNNYKQSTYKIDDPDYNTMRYFVADDLFAYHSMYSTKLHVYNLKSNESEPIILSMRYNPEMAYHNGPEFIKSGKYLIHFIYCRGLTVWNLENRFTVFDQSCGFSIIYVDKNLIVLENYKKNFQVLNIETSKIEYGYEGITNVCIMDGRVVFTTTDDVIHILKWVDKSKVTLKCCKQTKDNRTLLVKNDFLLSFCEHSRRINTLCVWDIKTKTKLHSTVLDSSYYIRNASFKNKYLYIEKRNKNDLDDPHQDLLSLELWDYTKGNVVTTVKRRHLKYNLSNHHVMVTSNSDKLGLWCFRTKDFICDEGEGLYAVSYSKELELSETKIVCVERMSPSTLLFSVRDYEIDVARWNGERLHTFYELKLPQ